MTNEEIKAKYESLKSMDDCYAMMVENGYKGSKQDFGELAMRAANDMSMDLDDMDKVAGGFDFEKTVTDVVDTVVAGYNKTVQWVKDNPETTVEIVGGTAAAVIGLTYAVKKYNDYQDTQAHKDMISKSKDAGNQSFKSESYDYLPYFKDGSGKYTFGNTWENVSKVDY